MAESAGVRVKSEVWMITWMAMVSSQDRPREGARGAQGTCRGDPAYRGDPAFLAAVT